MSYDCFLLVLNVMEYKLLYVLNLFHSSFSYFVKIVHLSCILCVDISYTVVICSKIEKCIFFSTEKRTQDFPRTSLNSRSCQILTKWLSFGTLPSLFLQSPSKTAIFPSLPLPSPPSLSFVNLPVQHSPSPSPSPSSTPKPPLFLSLTPLATMMAMITEKALEVMAKETTTITMATPIAMIANLSRLISPSLDPSSTDGVLVCLPTHSFPSRF